MTDVFEQGRIVGQQMKAEGHSLVGRINVYACTPPPMPNSTMKGGCLHWIVTIDRAPGVTPMFVKCGHCEGMATSRMYKVGPGHEPTHEWFRPTSEAELPEGYSLENVGDHIARGGLLLRPIGDGEWIAPNGTIRAFVADEQRRFAAMRPMMTRDARPLPGLPSGERLQ